MRPNGFRAPPVSLTEAVHTPVAARRAAERWFLDHGLPSVLTPRSRLRAVWPRSAPALTAVATVALGTVVVYLLLGNTDIDFVGQLTTVDYVVLTILALTLPLATVVGWFTARVATNRAQGVVSSAAVAVISAAAVFDGDASTLIVFALVVVLILASTASGIGSVLGWAVRFTLSELSAAGGLLVRALPVVLLTVLVFFNSPVWLMSATVTRGRLWRYFSSARSRRPS